MKIHHLLAVMFACLIVFHFASADPGRDCEWCGAHEAPEQLKAETTIAGLDEPGRRLVLTGTVYQSDGETPAPGVLLYFYHTNAEGRYPTRGDEIGNARRHGYLRGWVVTHAQGGYTVQTIKPGSYPEREEPAHIHMTVKEPGRAEYWIDSVLFKGDPEITERIRNRRTGRGGSGIIELEAQADGSLRGRRDVILMSEGSDG